jgi:hypothetical protein
MCPTILGRVETRLAILTGPLVLSLLLWLATGSPAWTELIGLLLAQGWVLDALFYARVIRWQPPWLTAVLGLGEFVIVYILAHVCGLELSNVDAIWFYWACWALAVGTRIVVLPLVRLTWLEDGGEFRAIHWTVVPEREPHEVSGASAVEPRAAPLLQGSLAPAPQLPRDVAE